LSKELSIKEVENLGYYDFMGYVGVPFFNIGGRGSIDRLAEVCHISAGSRVLEVGCGTGGNACYLAEKYGCIVVGIDIAELMVKQATARAEKMGLTDRASFKVGNAYHLDFPDRSFDTVVTVFVSQFLDPAKTYPEFNRVLSVGGYLGINELYRVDDVPPEAAARVDSSILNFCELTQLPFKLRSSSTWRSAFEASGFTGVTAGEYPNSQESPYSQGIIDAFGGWGGFAATLWKTLVYGLRSGKMRKKYVTINRVKKTLIRNSDTSRYIGYIICAGR
jgi:SAM-dependent methyltransferase